MAGLLPVGRPIPQGGPELLRETVTRALATGKRNETPTENLSSRGRRITERTSCDPSALPDRSRVRRFEDRRFE